VQETVLTPLTSGNITLQYFPGATQIYVRWQVDDSTRHNLRFGGRRVTPADRRGSTPRRTLPDAHSQQG